MKGKTFSLLIALGVAYSVPSNAACTTDIGNEWECLEVWDGTQYQDRTDMGLQGFGGNKGGPGVIPFVFEGYVSLSHWSVGTLNCTWDAGIYLEVDSSGSADIEVASLTLSGSSTCANQSVVLPLTFTSHDPDDIGDRDWGSITTTSNELFTLLWTAAGDTPVCEDYLDIQIGNDTDHLYREDPSYIKINQDLNGYLGTCTMSGTLTTTGHHDVNLW